MLSLVRAKPCMRIWTNRAFCSKPQDPPAKPVVKSREYFAEKMKQQQEMLSKKKPVPIARVQTTKERDYAQQLAEKFPEISKMEEELKQRREYSATDGALNKTWWQRIKYQIRYGHASRLFIFVMVTVVAASYGIKNRKEADRLLEEKLVKTDAYEQQISELEGNIVAISSHTSTNVNVPIE